MLKNKGPNTEPCGIPTFIDVDPSVEGEYFLCHNILTYQIILYVKGNQMLWKDRKILHKEYRYFQDVHQYGLLIQVTLIR